MSEQQATVLGASHLAQGGRTDPPAKARPNAKQGHRRIGTVRLSVLAVVIGIMTGLGAVFFAISSASYTTCFSWANSPLPMTPTCLRRRALGARSSSWSRSSVR